MKRRKEKMTEYLIHQGLAGKNGTHNLVARLRHSDFEIDTEAADRIEALEAENASLATVWFEFMKCCEGLEDEAEQKITPDNPNAHDTGFWRGQKHATKVIRHSASKALRPYDTPAKDEQREQEAGK